MAVPSTGTGYATQVPRRSVCASAAAPARKHATTTGRVGDRARVVPRQMEAPARETCASPSAAARSVAPTRSATSRAAPVRPTTPARTASACRGRVNRLALAWSAARTTAAISVARVLRATHVQAVNVSPSRRIAGARSAARTNAAISVARVRRATHVQAVNVSPTPRIAVARSAARTTAATLAAHVDRATLAFQAHVDPGHHNAMGCSAEKMSAATTVDHAAQGTSATRSTIVCRPAVAPAALMKSARIRLSSLLVVCSAGTHACSIRCAETTDRIAVAPGNRVLSTTSALLRTAAGSSPLWDPVVIPRGSPRLHWGDSKRGQGSDACDSGSSYGSASI